MTNYMKKSEFWLKKRRLANERRFAKMHPVEKARIVHRYILSSLRWLGLVCLLFIALSGYFSELTFLYLGIIPFLVWISLSMYYMKRKWKLRRYQDIASLQKMDPFDFEEYVLNLYNRL